METTRSGLGLTLVVAMLLALVAGCGPGTAAPTPAPAEVAATSQSEVQNALNPYPLAATAWELDSIGPPEQPVPLVPDSRANVVYFWDRYGGFDGCNWFLGVYSATASGELRNQRPARTTNICGPEELYTQAALFGSSLENATHYLIEGEQLIQNTAGEQRLLTFNPATPMPMLGTEWSLVLWWQADRQLWTPVIPTTKTTITFAEGGQASGSGGCNNYTVSYEGDLQIEKVIDSTTTFAELPTLTFGPVASQMATCPEPEGIMDQEQAFFTALGSVAYYFKLGGMLLLLDDTGTPFLALAAGG
jgi:heat shock protein HslJ